MSSPAACMSKSPLLPDYLGHGSTRGRIARRSTLSIWLDVKGAAAPRVVCGSPRHQNRRPAGCCILHIKNPRSTLETAILIFRWPSLQARPRSSQNVSRRSARMTLSERRLLWGLRVPRRGDEIMAQSALRRSRGGCTRRVRLCVRKWCDGYSVESRLFPRQGAPR